MKKKKDRIKEYNDKYGLVSKSFKERILQLNEKLRKKDLVSLPDAISKLKRCEWNEYNFTIYLVPRGTPRPRSARGGTHFYVAEAGENSRMFRDFLRGISDELEEIGQPLITICTPCEFNVCAYFPTPNQMSNLEKFLAELNLINPLTTPDFDNMVKTYADMMQKHLMINDSLIVKSVIEKTYSLKPRIEIQIRWMKNHDCKYNKKKIEGWKFYNDYNGSDLDSLV